MVRVCCWSSRRAGAAPGRSSDWLSCSGVEFGWEAAGGDGAPAVDGDADEGFSLAQHGGAVFVPVGVFACDAAVVLDEVFEGVGQVEDFGGAVDLDVGAVEVVGEHAHRDGRGAAGVAGFGALWVGGHDDAALGVDAAGDGGDLQSVGGGAAGDQDAVVAGAEEVEQLRPVDEVGGGDLRHDVQHGTLLLVRRHGTRVSGGW